MTVPTLIGVLAVMGYPWVYSAWLSLNRINPLLRTWHFVGLSNYSDLARSSDLTNALKVTVIFAVMVVVGTMTVGMIMALVLNATFRGRGAVRTIVLLPWAVTSVVVGQIFLLIYNGTFGTLNGFLYQIGVIHTYVGWLGNGTRALALIALTSIWSGAPLAALLLLAALQGIPQNLYRAAQVDGASAFAVFRRITFPYIRPMFLLVIILTTINAALAFDLIYVMTKGGPGNSTTVLPWWGYVTTFQFGQYGQGSAILYTLSLLILLISILYFRLLSDRPASDVSDADLTGSDMLNVSLNVGRPSRSSTSFVRPTIRRGLFSGKSGRRLRQTGLVVAIIVIVLWTLLPFYVAVNASLSQQIAFLSKPPRWFPYPPTLDNFRAVLFGEEVQSGLGQNVQAQAMLYAMRNSLIVSVAVTLINVVIGTAGGYAYSRYSRSKFIASGFWLLMFTRMIPSISILVPFFLLFQKLHLNNSLIGLIVAFTSFILPLTVWIMKSYFDSVSSSMERAALVDGCSRLSAFIKVAVPVAIPGIIASALFAFIVSWNQFLFPVVLTSSVNTQTLPVRMAAFVADQRVWNPAILYAAGIYAILPPVILTILLQRYLIQGMTAGAVKG